MKGYPRWFSKMLIVLIFLTVVATGFALLPQFFDLRYGVELMREIPVISRRAILLGHVFAGLVCAVLLGALLPIHIRVNLRRSARRNSGIVLTTTVILLVLSGAGIQYAADETSLKLISSSHVGAGLVMAVAVLAHSIARNLKPKG